MLGKTIAQHGVFFDDVDKHNSIALIKQAIKQGISNIVIADPHLCLKAAQKYAQKTIQSWAPDYKIIWEYFENNPTVCEQNIRQRIAKGDSRDVFTLLGLYSKQYYIPVTIKPRKVWKNNDESDI